MITRDVSFADFLRCKKELLNLVAEQNEVIYVEKRDVAHYARFVMVDSTGNKVPLNVTPAHRIELVWKHTLNEDPVLEKISLVREGKEIGVVDPSAIDNRQKFKQWLVQHTYCYFE